MISAETLAEATADNGAFSKDVPGLQLVWDSSSIGPLKECPRKYYYTIILGYQPSGTRIDLAFGIAFHAALETYDKEFAFHGDHNVALFAAVRRALEDSVTRLLDRFIPWDSDKPNKTRETLVRSVVWYIETFGQNDIAKTVILSNGKPAVELSFRFDIGNGFALAGHLDRVVEWQGQSWIMDRKTTGSTINSKFFKQFTPDTQMTLYTLAGHVVFNLPTFGVIIDGVQLAVNFTRFERGFVTRAPSQLEEWLADLNVWLDLATKFAEQRYWPMNDKSCDKFGGCPFRDVCGKVESVRPAFLAGSFSHRKWDPTEAR